MAVAVDVDRLEELYEVGDEVVLADLVLGGVELFHEVDEGGQLKALGVELELLLEDLHVLLGEHGHDALHVLPIGSLFLEDVGVEVEVVD